MSIQPYLTLIRFDRPIGTLLLLWPTFWALWLAANGRPDLHLIIIFSLGTFVMRSAGCIVNDFADRNVDGAVERTRNRPLATGELGNPQAMIFFTILLLIAFGLVLLTNRATVILSLGAVLLAIIYPYAKRFTHWPQLVLGAAFSWGIPMAFTAVTGELPAVAWLIFAVNLLWTTAYDTFYAMVDRDDDIKVGIKSTAILFGSADRLLTTLLQGLVVLGLLVLGSVYELSILYYLGVTLAALLFVYQQWLVRGRERAACFKAFLNNNWVGLSVFTGILAHYSLYG